MKAFGRLGMIFSWTAVLFSTHPGAALAADPPGQVGDQVIGIYDSRVIAYAHFWSGAHQRELAELARAAKAAKKAGETERFQGIEAELKRQQEMSHLQVFSTAPADEALAALNERLPAIEREAGVTQLVSKWDEPALKQLARARQVDVTDRLLKEFTLDEKHSKTAQEIRRQKPLALEEARRLIRQGKL